MESREQEKEGFDLTVTHRDKRSGIVTGKTPYRLRIVGQDRRKLFERPVGSGNLWNIHGKPVGRWLKEEKEDGEIMQKYDPKAKHIDYKAPMTEDQKLAASLNEVHAQNEALKAELAAMKAEQEKLAKAQAEQEKANAASATSKAKKKEQEQNNMGA